MTKYLNQISLDLVEKNLENYWAGFELVAYALYDNSSVYLFNHPKYKNNQQCKYQILERDEQFNGCTIIMYKEYPTAIVDLELYGNYEELYSILVHELFHGFQYIKGEKRFADETLAITYPLIRENVELRNQERSILFNALFEIDFNKKKQYINTFIAIREKRASSINNYLLFENLIETIEGPAWYVELKAYSNKSNLEYNHILEKYGEHLIDKNASTLNIRKSCYSSGLVICLLLDDLLPDWKENFWGKEETIYDLLKQISHNTELISDPEINSETEKVINFVKQDRRKTLDNFEEQKGIHLYIQGEITAKSFDPMNIVSIEDRLLHRNFLKVRINNEDYLIKQPVIAYCRGGLQNITKLHLILNDKPIENNDFLTVDGIGVIRGRYEKKGKDLHLYVD